MMLPRLTILLTVAAVGVAGAQGERSDVGPGQRGAKAMNRAALEASVGARLARRAKMELGLSDDQMHRLVATNRKYAAQHRDLDQREGQTRRALRDALLEAPSADQDRRVGELHEQLMQLQRQRLDVNGAEQRELGGFLTNVQRVRFQALQENFRRQLLDATRPPAAPPTAGTGGRPPA
jgi:hypothetical protein